MAPLTAADFAASVLQHLIGSADREHLVVLYLDAGHRITHAHRVSVGTATSTSVHPREVFKGACLANAVALIMGHNHPSGSVSPSKHDQQMLERLKAAGDVLGIAVLDSVIVGPGREYWSTASGPGVVRPHITEHSENSFDDHEVSIARSGDVASRRPSAAGPHYACPDCGSPEVELSFPVWLRANDPDNRSLWHLDAEASPEKDSDKGYCPSCNTNVLVLQTEAPITERDSARQAAQSLEAIHGCLDAKTWTPDTLDAIAEVLRDAGFTVREPPSEEE